MTVKRTLIALAFACCGLVLGAIGPATHAQAAAPNAGAWVVAPQWWGWCPGGAINKPVQVNVINYTAGSMNFSGWRGADKTHIAVVRGQKNQIQVSVLCTRTGWQSSGGYHYLSVDRDGRTFFTGVDGGVYRQ